MPMIRILHLSDIHLGTGEDADFYLEQLSTDLTIELNKIYKLDKLDFLVVSGDVGTFSTLEEYDAATRLVIGIVDRFSIGKDRIVLVPGNHDLNWKLSKRAYRFQYIDELPENFPEEKKIPAGDEGVLTRDDDAYKKRFRHFSEHFYEPVAGKPYPEDYDRQGMMFIDEETRILFLGLNSCWQIDHHYKVRSGIHTAALSHALSSQREFSGDEWLKIAVFHHPVTGRELMEDTDFLEQLSVHGFRAVLHGHIHEAKKENYEYDSSRSIHIVGAGTFGAPAPEQVTGIPLQYNLLFYDPEKGTIAVESRKKEKPRGAWCADARWGDKNNPVPRYEFEIRAAGKAEEKNEPQAKRETRESSPKRIDSAPLRRRYLQEIASVVGNLPWGPVDPDYGDATCSAGGEKSISLVDIYISLDTREFEKPPETEDQVRRHMELKEEDRRISAQDMANRESRLVLLGDPGAGKSTLVNYLAYAMANAGLEKGTGRWLEKLKESGEWDCGVLLPVRVLLREFADDIRKRKPERGGADLLKDHLKEVFQASEYADYWGHFYDGLLEPEPDLPYLVLLDGLDEVPSDLRQAAMESIEAFAEKYSAHRYIVTCRIYAYIGKGQQLKGFKQATLMPFDQERIDAFVDFWYSKLAKLGRFTEKEAGERKDALQKATRRPDLFGLARRPLLMTAMAMLHSFRGQLPDDRVELYRSTVDLLLRRWESRVGGEKGLLETLDVPGLKMKTLESALYDVAFEMHGGADPEAETADISEGMLMGIVKKRLGDFRKAEIFVNYVRTRAGLLVCHRPDTFAFPHRTFQEFMAACHLVESADYPVESVELIKEDLRKWRVVFVLAARRAAIGQGLSAINNLCPVSVGEAESTDAAAFRYAEVAAEALMEIGAFEVEQKELGKLVAGRVRNWLTRAIAADGILEAKERASMGNTLALLGDARPEITTLDKMEFCLVPGGDFVMSENDDPKEICSHLKYPFWMGRFPVTNAQYRLFMDAGGYAEERFWEEAVRNEVWKDGMVKGLFDDEPRNHPQRFAGPYGLPNHPVVGVTWYEAMAFARWLESHWRERQLIPEDWRLGLPTEAQWEKAARGGLKVPERPVVLTANKVAKCDVADVLIDNENSARKYPWGDELDSEKMNIKETGIGTTSTPGCFSSGKSPCGCEDMSGNVWEWTRSEKRKYPYKPRDGREDTSLFTNDTWVSNRGGSFFFEEKLSRCGFRNDDLPDDRDGYVGFRILLSPPYL